jgi:DnaJ family protein C protein 2
MASSSVSRRVSSPNTLDVRMLMIANETLTKPELRRQFDSVDWNIEDEVPDLKSIPADKYCEVVAPIFAREARFSRTQPMASFGGNDASKKEVEGFYDAWYNFDSWRSFEWHDKEANEGSDSYV